MESTLRRAYEAVFDEEKLPITVLPKALGTVQSGAESGEVSDHQLLALDLALHELTRNEEKCKSDCQTVRLSQKRYSSDRVVGVVQFGRTRARRAG